MEDKNKFSISVVHNGPLIVNSEFTLIDKDGVESLQKAKVALCRCGHSHKKPFCDGTHKTIHFDDTADN